MPDGTLHAPTSRVGREKSSASELELIGRARLIEALAVAERSSFVPDFDAAGAIAPDAESPNVFLKILGGLLDKKTGFNPFPEPVQPRFRNVAPANLDPNDPRFADLNIAQKFLLFEQQPGLIATVLADEEAFSNFSPEAAAAANAALARQQGTTLSPGQQFSVGGNVVAENEPLAVRGREGDIFGDPRTGEPLRANPAEREVPLGDGFFQKERFDPITGESIENVGQPFKKKAGIELTLTEGDINSGKAAIEPFTGTLIPLPDVQTRKKFQAATLVRGLGSNLREQVQDVQKEGLATTAFGSAFPTLATPTTTNYNTSLRTLVVEMVFAISGVTARKDEIDVQMELLPSANLWQINAPAARAKWNAWTRSQAVKYGVSLPLGIRAEAEQAMVDSMSIGLEAAQPAPPEPQRLRSGATIEFVE